MNNYRYFGKIFAGLAIFAMTLGFSAAQSWAATAQNATIVNVVKVDYKDANGNGAYTESASATVTVDLLAATPTLAGPTPASGQTVDSGATQAYEFTLYGNANGTDLYDFAVAPGTSANTGSPTSNNEYIFSSTAPDGTVTLTGNTTTYTLANLQIGASVILSDNNGDTVNIPAGTLNNLGSGDFVVINGTVYKVNATTAGTVAVYNSAGHVVTPETNGTISLYLADGVTAANFGAVDLTGAVISERWLVDVRATAVTTDTADAVTYFNVTLTDDLGAATSASVVDVETTFLRSQVAVTKVANPTNAKPGENIEYTVTIAVTGSNATSVTVLDAVPVYTTLVTYSDSYGGTAVYSPAAASTYFAEVSDGVTTVSSTTVNSDDEGSGNFASGDAAGNAAGNALHFYLGTGSDASTGGTVAAGTTYTIKYTVRID